ncbi:hypothetical protein C8J56DRAFT_922551 [Mycena floridula]|nr:hypothetical protein C8J56DRAFT_922551 [Mycena floridula]
MVILPDEIWLLILSPLSNRDLVHLLCVSRQTRRVALELLLQQDSLPEPWRWLSSHLDVDLSKLNTRLENDAGHFSLLASMYPIIPFIDNLRKLTVILYDTRPDGDEGKDLCKILRRRRVPELEIKYLDPPFSEKLWFDPRPDPYDYVEATLTDVSTGSYLFLRDGCFQASTPRKTPLRIEGRDQPDVERSPFQAVMQLWLRAWSYDFPVNLFLFTIAVILSPFLISLLTLLHLTSWWLWGRSNQHWRVAKDLQLPPKLAELSIVDLPFPSRISKFIVVDHSKLTRLSFGPLPHLSQQQIFLALESVQLPQLKEISLGDKQNVDLRFFLPFIQKHTIRRLFFGLESISKASVSQFSAFPVDAIAKLEYLSGPPAYLQALMIHRATFDRLEILSIHCGQLRTWRSFLQSNRPQFHNLVKTLARLPTNRAPALTSLEFMMPWSETLDWLRLEGEYDEAGVLENIEKVVLRLDYDTSDIRARLGHLHRNVYHVRMQFPDIRDLDISLKEPHDMAIAQVWNLIGALGGTNFIFR